jgi:hypothetical protein
MRILAASIITIWFRVVIARADVTLTTMVTFDGTNGYLPQDGLVQGRVAISTAHFRMAVGMTLAQRFV